MYTENINVIIAMDGYMPTEKNNISLLAISGANVLSAVCIQEPQKNETYRNELLKITHTDFLTNTMVEIGVITGYNLRDVYTDKFWDDLNYYKLDREFIIGSIQPYLLNSNQISNLPRHVVIDKLKRKYGCIVEKFSIYNNPRDLFEAHAKDFDKKVFIDLESDLKEQKNVFTIEDKWIFSSDWYFCDKADKTINSR